MVVLDSDVLVGILREDKDALSFMQSAENRNESTSITVINLFEILKGISSLSDQDKIRKIENLAQSFRIYNLDVPSSYKAAEVSAQLKSSGKIIDFQDICIASITITNNETLVTRNTKHFSRIKGLKIEKW